MLLYAICLRGVLPRWEFSALERAHLHVLRIMHTPDIALQGWAGTSGYVGQSSSRRMSRVALAELSDKIKIGRAHV